MPRVIVLGTGTGVGKTYATCAVLEALAGRAVRTLGLKPIETGIPKDQAAPPPGSDAARLELAATAAPPRPHPLYAFPDPLSPHLAARLAATTISLPNVKKWMTRVALQYNTYDWLFAETAGGALSPLGPGITNAELSRTLEPDICILVAPNALGVLHDVTSTLTALATRHVHIDYVLLSACRPTDPSTGTNAAEIRALGIAETVFELGQGSQATALADALLSTRN